jgi:hypothetical protein
MKRNELGGFPCEVEKEGNVIILRFFPRTSAKYPDSPVLTLKLTEKDKQTLLKILA